MNRLLAVILIITSLSGCAGYNFSKDAKPINTSISSSDLIGLDVIQNGTKRYNEGTKWCGLTIWMIIPIPLWLPTCHSYTEITFVDGHAIRKTIHNTDNSLYICGPGVWFGRMVVGDNNFCIVKDAKE